MGHYQSKAKSKPDPKPDRGHHPPPTQPVAAPERASAAPGTTGGFTMGAAAAPAPTACFPAEIDLTSFLSLLPRELQKVRSDSPILRASVNRFYLVRKRHTGY